MERKGPIFCQAFQDLFHYRSVRICLFHMRHRVIIVLHFWSDDYPKPYIKIFLVFTIFLFMCHLCLVLSSLHSLHVFHETYFKDEWYHFPPYSFLMISVWFRLLCPRQSFHIKDKQLMFCLCFEIYEGLVDFSSVRHPDKLTEWRLSRLFWKPAKARQSPRWSWARSMRVVILALW